jgi:putative transcriptional regulator
MKLVNNLKVLRESNGNLSQGQLADIVGCSRQTIISIEKGCKNPSVELGLKIAHALNTPMDGIFALEEGRDKDRFCKRISDFFSFN